MNNVTYRAKRRSSLPTVLLMLASGAGFAPVGQADDIPHTTVTAQASPSCGELTVEQEAMHAEATRAVWDTRISVATDLYERLSRQHRRSFRVAGSDAGKRG